MINASLLSSEHLRCLEEMTGKAAEITAAWSERKRSGLLISNLKTGSLKKRPPNIPSEADELLLNFFNEVASHQEVLIAGDFNAPTEDWVNLKVGGVLTSFSSNLMDLNLDQPLVQVNIPTRFIENQRANYLDLIFTEDFSNIDRVYSFAPLNADILLEYILFPELLVEQELQNLKEAKSSGPDELPAKFLKELAGELFKPLANIFNLSL
ncbi:unnamed protein product [Schistocephalus solidus]|uniref:Endo/exonuclease/phosphatase domain-containing protein n=1 Tax=Schistocephalus solidus TaxID=70667 RepID=A0A183S8J3_SCHSO|nr:unnamed protein product [Schistocephalus solidus]